MSFHFFQPADACNPSVQPRQHGNASVKQKRKKKKKASEKVGVCLSTQSSQVHILSVNIKD